jgi:hypothetical protein
VGRNAVLGVCHCLPFLRMPLGAGVVVVGEEDGREVADGMVGGDRIVVIEVEKVVFTSSCLK